MAKNYASLAFTNAVKRLQEQHGSRKAYARMEQSKYTDGLSESEIMFIAKRELYLTSKPVKEIAYELGFEDEFYFSRFFKKNAEISPQYYRDMVGFAAGESG